MFPPWKANVKWERWHHEAHQVDVVHGVGFLRRHIRAVAVRSHQGEHDEVRLQREAVLGFEGSGDPRVNAHPV